MALLRVTQKEIEKAQRPEEGFYLAEVIGVKEEKQKPKEGRAQGMNAVYTIRLIENVQTKEDYQDREKDKQYYMPLSDDGIKAFNFPFVEAIFGKPIEQIVNSEFDSEKDFVKKQLYVHVRHDIYKKNESDKGMEVWEIDEFRPTTAPPF